MSRRGFFGKALIGAVAASGLGAAAMSVAHAKPPTKFSDIHTLSLLNLGGLKGGNDIRVLNYALLLEDLESDMYVQAVQRLTVGGVNAVGKTIPGLGFAQDEPDVAYISEFAEVELEHRDFLRNSLNGLLSGLAIKPYKHDFGMESKSRQEVLDLILLAEDTGVKAYLGAVPKLRTRAFITPAAAIQGTEARHTTVLTIVYKELYGSSKYDVAPLAGNNHGADIALDPDTVLGMVGPFIVA